MNEFIQLIKNKMKNKKFQIALPEHTDPRILQAAILLLREFSGCRISFCCRYEKLAADISRAALAGLQPYGGRIDSLEAELDPEEICTIVNANSLYRPLKLQELAPPLCLELYKAGIDLAQGACDVVLAGAIHPTADVIRAAMRCVALASDAPSLSGAFVMAKGLETYLYTDCGVQIQPKPRDLVASAWEAVRLWKILPLPANSVPRVAFLSFATKGSAVHPTTRRVVDAFEQFQSLHPEICADGELQFDAAIDPGVAQKKAPASKLAGQANVFVFPDLNSGNLAYKITERLGGYSAFGPLLLGLAKPFSDLSRGTTVEGIVASALINALRATEIRL